MKWTQFSGSFSFLRHWVLFRTGSYSGFPFVHSDIISACPEKGTIWYDFYIIIFYYEILVFHSIYKLFHLIQFHQKKFKVHLVGHSYIMSKILKLYKKYMWSLGYSLEKLKYVSVKIAQMKMSTGEKWKKIRSFRFYLKYFFTFPQLQHSHLGYF